jgi:uncharacterized membrane protein
VGEVSATGIILFNAVAVMRFLGLSSVTDQYTLSGRLSTTGGMAFVIFLVVKRGHIDL